MQSKYEFKNTTEALSAYILSEDQNTLRITEPSPLAGVYKATLSCTNYCENCAFLDTNCPSSYLKSSYCSPAVRDDAQAIKWIKQEQPKVQPETLPEPIQETLEPLQDYQPKPHVHKDVIQKWLDDTNQKVWYWSKDFSVWGEMIGTPQWDDDMFFAVGDKPTEPPAKMLRFPWGTIQFYAPKDIESDINTFNTNYGSSGVFTQGYYYFANESHRDLFKRALTEYQDNFNKFLKGEFE